MVRSDQYSWQGRSVGAGDGEVTRKLDRGRRVALLPLEERRAHLNGYLRGSADRGKVGSIGKREVSKSQVGLEGKRRMA